MESKTVAFLNKLSFALLMATLFLSIFFFIPYLSIGTVAVKGFLLSIGATLSLFFWLVARLGEGKFAIPEDRVIIYAASIPFVFLISSIFSYSRYVSFLGSGFEEGTFGSMLTMFIIFFLSSVYFQTEKRLKYFLGSLFIGSLVVSIYQIIFILISRFAPKFLWANTPYNLIGSWSDLALFFGLTALLSLLALEFTSGKRFYSIIQYFLLVVSMFFIMVINMPLVWLLVGLFSVVIFVYSISVQQSCIDIVYGSGHKKRFPFASLVIILLCLIFLVGNNIIPTLISKYVLNISNSDPRVSMVDTSKIAIGSIKHNALLGTGPNTFAVDWNMWQPSYVTQSVLWNTSFNAGFGLVPTFFITTGLLGIIAILLFLVTLIMRSVQSIRIALDDPLSNYFTLTTLVVFIYSWASIIFYVPNILLLMLAFASSGILIGILVYKKIVPIKNISFLIDPRKSFFSILGLMILMIGTISFTYLYTEKLASAIFFSRSLNNNADLQSLIKSENNIGSAIRLDENDIYYRSLSQIYIAQIAALASDKSISPDVLKSSLQQLVNNAQLSALKAVYQNPKQYLNQMNLGNVYASFVPLNVANVYENANIAYNQAQILAPHNPSILLAKAELEFLKKNNDKAKDFANQALIMKSNYTDASLFLAQIEVSEGNLTGAIKQTELAAEKTPYDPTIYFTLGSYRYNSGDYNGAVDALVLAINSDNNYLNAYYMLAQSYQKLGRNADALAIYKQLLKVVPDNQDIKNAINTLSNSVIVSPSTNINQKTKSPLKAK